MSAVAIPSSRPTRSLRAQAPRDLLYVATSAALGLVWLIVLVVLTVVGLSLTLVLFIGVPVLVFTLELGRWGANTERERAALVLTGPIPRPPRRRIADSGGGILSETRRRSSNRNQPLARQSGERKR
jgi:hypothetical protein